MTTYYLNGFPVSSPKVMTTLLEEFIDYVYSFYNVVDGLYPVYGCTKIKIQVATGEYFDRILKGDLEYVHYEWGNGDSLDRERVRDIMFELFPSISYAKTNS